jgi:hypothetical protein
MHPFSKMPGSSGKLDKTPRVLILRGQAPEVCRTDEKPFQLFYFIHLNFMGPQSLWVEDVKRGELELFGEHFTLKVTTKATAGALTYVETKFRTAQQSYSITTRVMDCKGGVSGEVREMWDRASDRHVALL